ncbi:hypothetical protein GCM10023185_18350 [Hymenobacter saemangeumensis]|uniref:T9SS type A sorting domain-containing protein n=2 Tax=Hymenobacter saemangeumensis TaxID=1084522 RepID=A0ABP8IC18_9BACT
MAVAAVLLSLASASAQALTFDRAMTCASGPNDNNSYGPGRMVFDGQGNQYVIGRFGGSVLLGSTILSVSPNVVGLFVAKLDAQGNYLWATQTDDNQDGYATALAVDAAGDVYVSGGFRAFSFRLRPGVIVYNSSTNMAEGFVAKLSGSTGQWSWVRRVGGTRDDYINVLAVTPAGDLYVAGNSESQVNSFGPGVPLNLPNRSIPGSGGSIYRDAYLAKLSPTGTWLWARHVGNGNPYLGTLEVDPQGELYFTGNFTDSVRFGSTRLFTRRLIGAPNPMSYDVFVAKGSDSGAWHWAVQGDPLVQQNQLRASGGISDGQGHLYFYGSFEGPAARFGSFTLPNQSLQRPPNPMSPLYTNDFYSDAFIARFNLATQTWDWAISRGGPYSEYTTHVAADLQGRLYASGVLSSAPLQGGYQELAQVDAGTGAWRHTQALQPLYGAFLFLDRQSRLHLSSAFYTSSATLGNFTLNAAGPNQLTGVLARMTAGPLAALAPISRRPGLELWPNPASETSTVKVNGPSPGQMVEVYDVLGRVITQCRMPANGPLNLPLLATMPSGVYMVCSAGESCRLFWNPSNP